MRSGRKSVSLLVHAGGAQDVLKTSIRTRKRRERRKRRLQAAKAAPRTKLQQQEVRAALAALRGSSSRQRRRQEEWRRCHSKAEHRLRGRDERIEALESEDVRHRKDLVVDAKPSQAQNTQSILHGAEGPIPVSQWEKLDLGCPVLHSAQEGSAEIGKTGITGPAPS